MPKKKAKKPVKRKPARKKDHDLVLAEQMRQRTISDAAAVAKGQLQEELAKTVNSVQRMKIDLEVLDHELMTMAVGLDKNFFPKEKLDAIKAAYVVFGTLESGNTRRLIPPEHLQQNEGQGTYTSLFNRLALKPPTEAPLETSRAEDGVYDLIPRSPASVPTGTPLPPPGEAIDEQPAPANTSSRVITVEVG